MKAIYTIGLFSLNAVLFASCAPQLKVTSDYDKQVNFTRYKTFKFYNLKTTGSVSQLNADRIVEAIRANLRNKGMVETTDNPDLMVNAVTILKDKQSAIANTDFYGYGGLYRPYGYWGVVGGTGYTTVNTYNYIDGSLVIDIVDARTNKLVWEGTGNKDIDHAPDDPDKAINDGVYRIMQSYPPPPLPKP